MPISKHPRPGAAQIRKQLRADLEAARTHLEAAGIFVPTFSGRYQAAARRPLRVGVGPRPFQAVPGGRASRPVGSVTWGRGPVVLAEVAAFNTDRYAGELQGGVVTPGETRERSWSSGSLTASSWGLFKGPGGSSEGRSSSGFIFVPLENTVAPEIAEIKREVWGRFRRVLLCPVAFSGVG